jgi:aryl-alcohol dehydrogenase-like predicted oxidoreductase
VERRPLGRTGLSVPVVGMGTWRTFDVTAASDVAARREVVSAALESGSDLFDSSPMYGHAERVLARALAGRRDRAVVATKVWSADEQAGARQIEQALSLFDGRVDVYQVHNLVAERHWLRVLQRLKAEDRVRVVGVTHYAHSAFGDLARVMRSGAVEQVQLPLNVLDRTAERELLPLAADLGIGVLVMRPFGEGSLVRRPPPEDMLVPLRAYGVTTWAQALVKWILSDVRVSCAIPATSRVQHATDNAAAGDPPWFDQETRDYVRRLAER